MSGILYLVPTPIGNLKDITLRALDVLKGVDYIACEDTRVSGNLLKHYGVFTPLLCYHKFNERQKSGEIVALLLSEKNIAVITDAGTPGISDPAEILVREALKSEIRICPLPGASALLPALTASGLNNGNFAFLGFLPKQQKKMLELVAQVENFPGALVFYEAPHRIKKFLEFMPDLLPGRKFCVARELSKLHESFYYRSGDDIPERGEFVIVFEAPHAKGIEPADLASYINELQQSELGKKEIAKRAAEKFGIGKNEIYKMLLEWEKTME